MATDNPQFSVPVDFTGVVPWDGTRGGVSNHEPGAYQGRVTSAVEHIKDDGKKSLKVTVALDGAGETDLYLGTDFTMPKPGTTNKAKAATALLSIGIPLAKLPLVKDLTPVLFMGADGKGRPCYVIVKLVEGTDGQGRPKLNDKEFMTKEQFAAYRGTPTTARPAAPAAGPTTSPAAPDATALGDLFGGQ